MRLLLRLIATCAADGAGNGVRAQMQDLLAHPAPDGTSDEVAVRGLAQHAEGRLLPAKEVSHLVGVVRTNGIVVTNTSERRLGNALYNATSYFNHSCNPNAVLSFKGAEVSLRASRLIERGDEVTIAYTDTYRPREMRRAVLRATKGFVCRCARCASGTVVEGEGANPEDGSESEADPKVGRVLSTLTDSLAKEQ